jgi:hypothetical protein
MYLFCYIAPTHSPFDNSFDVIQGNEFTTEYTFTDIKNNRVAKPKAYNKLLELIWKELYFD